MNVTVVAPCGPDSPLKLANGVGRLEDMGFAVTVDPQCYATTRYTAGPDAVRAAALFRAARDPGCDVVWCARGGYGATRLLPTLEASHAPPPTTSGRPKTIVGFSDVTALHHFAAHRWGWRTVHGPMVCTKHREPDADFRATAAVVRGEAPAYAALHWLTAAPDAPIDAPIVGGNLSVWATLTGTPFQPSPGGSILFLEDVREEGYAIDRMLTQLRQAGGLAGVRAFVLGPFTKGPAEDELPGLFDDFGVPVAATLPSGHGDECAPLVLNAPHRLGVDGSLALL